MATLTIQLEDALARHVQEAARREHKPVSEWVGERVKPGADRGATLAALEAMLLV
jgi:predicted transcriptional regulator